jgi:predicted enzyme related to lactoylglutathione lyase
MPAHRILQVEIAMRLFKGINVVSLTVRDLAQAKHFYSEVLGLGTPIYDLPEAGWIEWQSGNDANISIIPATDDFAPSHQTTIVFNVNDCHTAVAELHRRGVRCDDPVGVPGMVTYASFYDPDGNRLQMVSAPPEG